MPTIDKLCVLLASMVPFEVDRLPFGLGASSSTASSKRARFDDLVLSAPVSLTSAAVLDLVRLPLGLRLELSDAVSVTPANGTRARLRDFAFS